MLALAFFATEIRAFFDSIPRETTQRVQQLLKTNVRVRPETAGWSARYRPLKHRKGDIPHDPQRSSTPQMSGFAIGPCLSA